MATTSLWKVDKRLDHVIDYATDKNKTKNKNFKSEEESRWIIRQTLNYATNSDKTEKQFYVSGINCEPETALKQMMKTKKKFHKDKYSNKNKIVAFHGYQSFAEGEATPELVHQIGVKVAEEMWGDRFEVIVTTHLNTKCLHNHFVINSVSFKDGYKYYSNLENTALFRKISDDICDEFGLKVLKKNECKKSKVDLDYFYKSAIQKSDYYTFAKEDIDFAIRQAKGTKQFESLLREMGYEFYYRAGKISIRREPYKRYIRIERAFGEEYSVERIRRRIVFADPIRIRYPKPRVRTIRGRLFHKGDINKRPKVKGIRALYLHYCYLLKVFPKHNLKYKLTPEMRKEVKKMERISEQNKFVCKYNICNFKDIDRCKKLLEIDLKKFLNDRDKLYYKRKKTDSEPNKDEINKEIIYITSKIKNIRNDIKLCDEVREKSIKIKEQVKIFELNQLRQKEEKSKKKERIHER